MENKVEHCTAEDWVESQKGKTREEVLDEMLDRERAAHQEFIGEHQSLQLRLNDVNFLLKEEQKTAKEMSNKARAWRVRYDLFQDSVVNLEVTKEIFKEELAADSENRIRGKMAEELAEQILNAISFKEIDSGETVVIKAKILIGS